MKQNEQTVWDASSNLLIISVMNHCTTAYLAISDFFLVSIHAPVTRTNESLPSFISILQAAVINFRSLPSSSIVTQHEIRLGMIDPGMISTVTNGKYETRERLLGTRQVYCISALRTAFQVCNWLSEQGCVGRRASGARRFCGKGFKSTPPRVHH